MKKYLEDLSCDELQAVFDGNSKLREKLWEHAIDNAAFWIGKYLNGLTSKAADYEIDYCGSWMHVRNERAFLEWVQENGYAFDLWYDIENREKLIETGLTLYDRLHDYYLLLSDENEDRMQKRLDEICEIFVDCFLERCRAEYDAADNEDYLFDCLYNMYDADYYIDTEEDGYTVYRDYTEAIA